MAIWPFNRKKQDQALPEDVQEYYETGQKQHTGMAWLLALGTLLVTVLLAILLFFGGRWVYQQLAGDEDSNQETTSQTSDQGQNDQGQQSAPPDNPSEANSSGTGVQQGSSSANTTTPSTATPTTGPSGSEIPDTGPGPSGLQ